MKNLKAFLNIALGMLALLFAATITSAEEMTKEKKPSKAALEKYDANKDGVLDEAEQSAQKAGIAAKAKATKEANLAKYDANKDGKLDEAEKAARKADEDAAKAAMKAEKEAKKAAKAAAKEPEKK
jgi:hypothetical protein